jgi:TolB-like protein/class 3 adenylate cyclase/Flp pilus assembly protein TadD
MPTQNKKEIQLEIAHVLFIDIVGYSKLSINEQRAVVDELTQIVRATEQFQKADASDRLIKIATGDGMALVFYSSPEAPVRCAIELSRVLKDHPRLRLRMGIHSGPVSGVVDVTGRTNLAGAGLNLAQRVMNCGDAGHILLSKHVADDLGEFEEWRPLLHDLGACEVKHAVRLDVTNLHGDGVGNATLPEAFRVIKQQRSRRWAIAVGAALIVLAAMIGTAIWFLRLWTDRASAEPEKSIAVLPFENLSDDKGNAYFAAGIQDEILTRIATIGTRKVISSVSTKQYSPRPANLPEIAHQLGVANILEGSVQKMADQVHVNVQLIRAATDEHLWAESYDRKLENIFGVEAEVATAVAAALNAKLTAAEQQTVEQKPTKNPEAYDAYLRGIALWSDPNNVEDLSTGTKALEEAVRLDPDFATAWAMLAQFHSDTYMWVDATPSRRAAAQKTLETALQLQPNLPEVQVAAAVYQYKILRDFEGARRSFEQLHTKLPNNVDILETLGVIALQQGRWDESRVAFDKAILLNPRNRELRADAAFVYTTTRDFSGALQCYDQALNIWPDDRMLIALKARVFQSLGELDQADALLKKLQPSPKDWLVVATICEQAKLRRRYSDAIPLLGKWLEANRPDQAGSLPAFWVDPVWESLGNLQRLSGDVVNAKASYVRARDKLEQRLKEAPDEKDLLERLAGVYAELGDSHLAMKYIERAMSLTPASKDAWAGPGNEEMQARIAARLGQKDLAISLLEQLIKTPYREPITPALLKLDPDWDALRDDPRFQKLVEEPQKPVALK